MKRRSLLLGIFAAGAGPAIVRAGSLMPIWTPSREIILPKFGEASSMFFGNAPYVVDEVWIGDGMGGGPLLASAIARDSAAGGDAWHRVEVLLQTEPDGSRTRQDFVDGQRVAPAQHPLVNAVFDGQFFFFTAHRRGESLKVDNSPSLNLRKSKS